VLIILFIQKRPRGLFALKGRRWSHDAARAHALADRSATVFLIVVRSWVC